MGIKDGPICHMLDMPDISGRIYQLSSRGLLLDSIKRPGKNPKCRAALKSFLIITAFVKSDRRIGKKNVVLNPLDFVHYSPKCPADMDWSALFPDFLGPQAKKSKTGTAETALWTKPMVEFADIGCGYGGLLSMLNFLAHLC